MNNQIDIFIIAALSADGFLGQSKDHSSIDWRSKEDGQFFMQKTREAKAVVMGSTTFATMRRPMPNRKHYVLTSNPSRYDQYDKELVEGIAGAPQEVISRVMQDGFSQLAVCGGSSVYSQFLESGLVSSIFISYEPIFFGQGVSLFDRSFYQHLKLRNIIDLSEQTKVFEYILFSKKRGSRK